MTARCPACARRLRSTPLGPRCFFRVCPDPWAAGTPTNTPRSSR